MLVCVYLYISLQYMCCSDLIHSDLPRKNLLISPPPIQLVAFPTLMVNLILFSFVVANFLISYFIEYIIDNMSLRRQMKRIKLILFPQSVDQVEYERIREEINSCASSWPPVIKCASVQDMRPEIFMDATNLYVSQSAQDLVNLKVIIFYCIYVPYLVAFLGDYPSI